MPRPKKGARLYLRKGRYVIRDGSTEYGTGCGPEQLEEAERVLARYLEGKWAPPTEEARDPGKVLIADALAFYGEQKAASIKTDAATMAGFAKHLLDWWGDRVLSDVKRSTCQEYVAHRTSQVGRHKRKVSDQTARRELEVLSAAIGLWDDEFHLTKRPKVVLPLKAETNRDALSRQEVARLVKAARSGGDQKKRSKSTKANRAHLARFILVSYYTGSRSGVTRGLSWVESLSDPWVDLEKGIVYRRGKAERDNRTKRRPLVKISRRLLAHLRRWRQMDQKKGIPWVIHHGGERVGTVRRGFEVAVKNAGLPEEVTPHWLRHTAATHLMEADVPSWEAAGYLGMTVATLEKHYGHHRPTHQAAARRALG